MDELNSGWYDSDLKRAANDDDKPKLLQEDYDERWEMIFDDRVVQFRDKFFDEWESDKKYAILLDCSSEKPYRESPTHSKIISRIKRDGVDDIIEQYTCSEPMGLVPRDWEMVYPCYAYNLMLKPKHDGYSRMVDVFSEELEFIKDFHEYWITFLPSNKLGMVKKALPDNISTIDVPFGFYNEPPFGDIIDEIEKSGRCTMFEHVEGWNETQW